MSSLPRGPNSPPFARMQPPPRPKEGPVLAVGGRAVVTSQAGGSDRVTLTDDNGTNALATLKDGVEVQVVAWRPRRGATRYRVVSLDGRFEGWLGAASLKPCLPPPPPPPVAVVAKPSPALPIRAARAATSPRARTTTPAIAKGAAIKSAARATKSRRIGTR